MTDNGQRTADNGKRTERTEGMFTVITCTYNAEGVLQRTLDSVARQTLPDVQHIIMDGASTDATMEMAGRYREQEQVHKVCIVSEPDKGLYDAMNKVLQLATGRYTVFLNAGDVLHADDTLERMAAMIGEDEYGVVYGNTDIVDEQGNRKGPRRLQPPEKLDWRSFSNGMLVCHQAFYANTMVAKRVRYDTRYRFSADVDWCIRIMKETEKAGMKMLNTGMVLCDYLDGGLTVKNHRASLMERFRVMREHYGLWTTLYKHITFIFRK